MKNEYWIGFSMTVKLPIDILLQITEYLEFEQVIFFPWTNVKTLNKIAERILRTEKDYHNSLLKILFPGKRVLMYKFVIENDYVKGLKLLFESEIEYYGGCDMYPDTFLDIAIKKSSVNIIKYLLETKVNDCNTDIYRIVVENNRLDILKLLWEHNLPYKPITRFFNVFTTIDDPHDCTLIDLACYINEDIVLYLYNTKHPELSKFTNHTINYYINKDPDSDSSVGFTLGIYPIKLTFKPFDQLTFKPL